MEQCFVVCWLLCSQFVGCSGIFHSPICDYRDCRKVRVAKADNRGMKNTRATSPYQSGHSSIVGLLVALVFFIPLSSAFAGYSDLSTVSVVTLLINLDIPL